nr:N-acetylmuramoyl-L-alanine amidase [Bacillota bacterium]
FVEGQQKFDEILKGGILRVRSGQNTIGVARLVFDLDKYIGHTWSPSAEGFGIDIELAEKLSGLLGRLILIDPGHGGKDGGAVGNALKEKDVNLDISLRLRALLETQGAVVIMTRSDDTKVELLERANIANLLLPDAIVCIHANSVISQLPNGTETYYFNNDTLSKELADSVHKSLVDRIRLTNRGLFKKEYYMVKETYSPSVLVEVGFLSNAQDAAMLSDQAFRAKAAEGIYDGLVSYFSGSAQEAWASMRENLYLASSVPSYQMPTALWPGLYIERPWKAEMPPDMTSLTMDQGLEGK